MKINLMKPKLFSLLTVFFCLISLSIKAQKKDIKFGKIDVKDLEMTVCEMDSSAPALILYSYGHFDAGNFSFTQHYRVKIFKKEGYSLATRKFPTSKKYNVKGKTYNLVDGEIVEDKLQSESIFAEKVFDNYYLINVAMPNVKEGSVIDLVITYNGFPSNWYFQETIPVQWSELKIDRMKNVSYNKNFFGYERLSVNENGHWIAKNIPAFKPEPYMNSRENYITKFEFEITAINIPGYYYEDIASNWEEVTETLLESTYFGLVLKTGSSISKEAKDIEEKYSDEIERLKAALDFLHEIEYNGLERVSSTENSFTYNLREKTGSSADINLMLIKLLKKMDFEVYPVVLSTKDNGFLSPINASLRKLNYVVAYVKLGDEYVLVDATDKLLPYYLLPDRCLNWRGRLIAEDLDQWIDLETTKKNEELVYYELALDEDMLLSGKLSHRRNDYAAYNFRKEYEQYASLDDYIEALNEKHHGLTVLDADIKFIDSIYYPVTDSYEVQIANQVYEMDSTLYLTLALFERIEENPFKAAERKYPVDFAEPIQKSGIIKIKLPDNYEVVELPKPAKIVLPDNEASFVYSTSNVGTDILLQFKLNINKTMFVLDEYELLKVFYNEIIKKEAEPVVIKINGHDS